MESKALLTAFDIPVVRALEARTINEALVLAESLGYPVAMKISSPDIPHKAAVGGVRLNIDHPQAVRVAFNDLTVAARHARPDAHIAGVTIERMHGKPHGRELAVGISTDPVFGPVVAFGAGGGMIELIRQRAVGLPPLNEIIARDMIRRTRAARLLQAYEDSPAVDESLVVQILLQLSEMICKLPHIKELEINPLIVDEAGALALDARFVIGPPAPGSERYPHMAISPYPMHLVTSAHLRDGSEITIRPIRPEDAEIEKDFVHRMSAESKYFRFMEQRRELTPSMLVRFTQIDYDREMALIATRELGTAEQQIGVARYVILPDNESCEFALAVSDELQGQGLGRILMQRLMEVAAAHGLKTIQGDVLASNSKMLGLMRALGFTVRPSRDDYNIRIVERPLH
jgi:acetyltransferase